MKREREEDQQSQAAAPDSEQQERSRRHCGNMAHQQRNVKYDRQIRIWGEHGQAALEKASICLIRGGPTGSEALKNLVLGGIGHFTVLDDSSVEIEDLGSNFMVEEEDLGKPRAITVCARLKEMNDAVEAEHVVAAPELVVNSDPPFFSKFSLVIATQIAEDVVVKLDAICRSYGVPFVVARSYGLIGFVRVSVKEHHIIESKPDNVMDDLRLHKPWPELKQLVEEFDVNTEDLLAHKHIPFAAVLIKVAEEWKASHENLLPATRKEMDQFKASITLKKKSDDEDNYKEALASAFRVWAPPKIGSELQSLLDDDAVEVDCRSADFWVLVAALKRFIRNEGDGELPLDGAIPDMHSFTDYYIRLQKIYQARAEADVSAVEAHVRSILEQIGRDPFSISRAVIKNFCKNARNLKALRYQTLAEEYSSQAGPILKNLLTMDNNTNVSFYVLLRAADRFVRTHRRYPGIPDENLEHDAMELKMASLTLLNDMGVESVSLSDDLIGETCRFGASELHAVASVIGGIASQEAIKILTRQFTPLPATLFYNAIDSTTSVLEF